MSAKAFGKIASGLKDVKAGRVSVLKGYRIKDGKLEKIKGFGLDASAKIKQRKSKKTKPIKRVP